MESNHQLEILELKESLASLNKEYDKGLKNQAEMQEKVDKIKFVVAYISADRKLKNTHKKELEQYKNMRKIDLAKNLNGKKYSIELEKLIRNKDIVDTIDKWIKTLYCSYTGCPEKAKILFLTENSDQIYCEYHAYSIKDLYNPINLEDELKKNNTIMNVLEKKLLFPQMKMALIRSYMEFIEPDFQIGK